MPAFFPVGIERSPRLRVGTDFEHGTGDVGIMRGKDAQQRRVLCVDDEAARHHVGQPKFNRAAALLAACPKSNRVFAPISETRSVFLAALLTGKAAGLSCFVTGTNGISRPVRNQKGIHTGACTAQHNVVQFGDEGRFYQSPLSS